MAVAFFGHAPGVERAGPALGFGVLDVLHDRHVRDRDQAPARDHRVERRKQRVDPRLVSAATDGPAWNVTVGDAVLEPTKPLGIARNVIGNSRASVTIPFDSPGSLHRIDDPDIGDKLYVVTAPGPARGLLKAQDFVEFRALASTQGLVIQPIADDLIAEFGAEAAAEARRRTAEPVDDQNKKPDGYWDRLITEIERRAANQGA